MVQATRIGRGPNRNFRPKREWWPRIRPDVPTPKRRLILDSGASRVASSFRSPCAVTIQEMLRCSVDNAWHDAMRWRES